MRNFFLVPLFYAKLNLSSTDKSYYKIANVVGENIFVDVRVLDYLNLFNIAQLEFLIREEKTERGGHY